MRLLVATPYLFPQGGGLERYARSISAHLAAAGHEVAEIGHATARFERVEGGARQVGVLPRARLSNTPLSLRYHSEARRLLRETRPHVVVVHTPVPGAAELAALAARQARVPYVVTYHAGRLAAPKGSPLALAAWAHRAGPERALLSGAAARIAVSEYVADRVFGHRACTIVPPGVDAERFAPGPPPVPGRILYVGPVDRAYEWKGFETLFQAFARLARDLPEARLRVVGQGDLVDRYQWRARAQGLQERVSFAGRVKEDDLPREYQRADVVVLPSLSDAESFGMVLAEANACGRPVVGSRMGGIPTFVRHGDNGLLAPPGDAAALEEAIRRVLEDPKMGAAMGQRGRARVLAEHRWDDLAKRTERVLAEAIAASGRAPRRTPP